MKAKKKKAVGKDSEEEQHNPSRSAMSKADKKSGEYDIDRTGIESIMKAAHGAFLVRVCGHMRETSSRMYPRMSNSASRSLFSISDRKSHFPMHRDHKTCTSTALISTINRLP
jgi:hypothetical protein